MTLIIHKTFIINIFHLRTHTKTNGCVRRPFSATPTHAPSPAASAPRPRIMHKGTCAA